MNDKDYLKHLIRNIVEIRMDELKFYPANNDWEFNENKYLNLNTFWIQKYISILINIHNVIFIIKSNQNKKRKYINGFKSINSLMEQAPLRPCFDSLN